VASLSALIAQIYSAPEWAVFYEVSNGTGANAVRRADAVALGVWPSRGHSLIGFEIKTDRRDWLRELANPEKAERVAAHCDSWYLVTSSPEVAKVEELPLTWGLYVANADQTKLINKKVCVPFPGRDLNIMSRGFAAAMLRKVNETMVPKAELRALVEAGVKEAVARTQEGRSQKHLLEEVARLKGILQTFKTITGVDMDGWQGPEKIGKAVQAVLDLDSDRKSIEHLRDRMKMILKDVEEALTEWPHVV